MKRYDNRAWLLLIPAGAIMAFVGVLPLVAVFNYSVLDIFTLQDVFYVGSDWYREIVSSERFHMSLLRSLLFSAIVLSIQIPLGVGIAMLLTRSGNWRTLILMLLALPMVVPWNMIPMMWLSVLDLKTGLVGAIHLCGWHKLRLQVQRPPHLDRAHHHGHLALAGPRRYPRLCGPLRHFQRLLSRRSD